MLFVKKNSNLRVKCIWDIFKLWSRRWMKENVFLLFANCWQDAVLAKEFHTFNLYFHKLSNHFICFNKISMEFSWFFFCIKKIRKQLFFRTSSARVKANFERISHSLKVHLCFQISLSKLVKRKRWFYFFLSWSSSFIFIDLTLTKRRENMYIPTKSHRHFNSTK